MLKWIAPALSGISLALLNGPALADTPVAAMEEVQRSVYGTPPEGSEIIKRQGDGVVFSEALQTLTESRALVRFIDGSGLAMGARSKVVVDDFVFDPSKAEGNNAVVKITLGTLRYVTGAMPKGGTVIQTPVATLTLRGTDVTVHVHPNGQTDVLVTEGQVENHNVVTGQTTMLSPGQSETDSELGNRNYKGDFKQYGLDNVTSTSIAVAAALINDIETGAGPGAPGDSDHVDNGHHRGGGNSGSGVGNGGGNGAGGGGNGGGGGGGNGGGGGGNSGGGGNGGGHGGGNGNH